VTILVPIIGSEALINGGHLTDQQMMIRASKIDFHAGSNNAAAVWSGHTVY